MRPSLSILDAELTSRIVDEAKRVLAEIGMEIRGPEMRRRLLEHGLPLDHGGERVLFPRDVVEAAIASAPSSFMLYDRAGQPHADLGGDRVHFVPGSSGLKVLDHRTGETRLANSTDFVEYVRLADGLGQHPVPRHRLLDQRRHRGPGLGRVAPVHDPDELDQAGRVGRVHRARRAAHGRDDAALPARPGRPRSPARCRSSRSPRPATSATARTPARTSSTASRRASRSRSCRSR